MATQRNAPFTINIAETDNQLVKKLSDVLKQSSDQAIEDGSTFRVGLSGKSLVLCMCMCVCVCLCARVCAGVRVHVRDKLNLR